MDNLSLFHHVFVNNNADKTLFLLHGTGGDENNFLFLDEPLNQNYNLVGLRGNVDENGLNRFFKRFSADEYDQENIKEETKKLDQFINSWCESHNLTPETTAFLGYSNGANMLLATLFYYPQTVKNLILMHSSLPFIPEKTFNFSNHSIFFSYGSNDMLITAESSKKAIEFLRSQQAKVTEKEYDRGHDVSREEVTDVVSFLLER